MVHELVVRAIGRVGGVVLLFGLLWLGLSMPSEHEFDGTAVRTGPLLVVILGMVMIGIGFGVLNLQAVG